MKLQKSKKKTPEELKNRLNNLFDTLNIEKNIHKTDINAESFKIPEKEMILEQKTPQLNLKSLKKELLKPLESIINNNFSKLSLVNTKNINKNTNVNNIQYTNYRNFSPNSTTLKKISENSIFSPTQENKKVLNIDYKTFFSPSENTEKNITNEFYKNSNKNINLKNITKNNNLIPGLQKGGVVKEPTVAYLHENEAVIPLKDSNEFSNFIQNTMNTVLGGSVKNETLKNINGMKTTNTFNSTTQKNNIDNSKKETKQQQQISLDAPISLSQQINSREESKGPTIPVVYAGSPSKMDFINSTVRTPKWRKSLG